MELMNEGGEFLALDEEGSIADCVCLECGGQRSCRFMDIHIVNLRQELPAYYRRLGYVEEGTLPFPAPECTSRPCSFIVMTKAPGD
jgi:hypothetical protein